MPSGNKTSRGYSQYVADDHPTWLQDYNEDMRKIDKDVCTLYGTSIVPCNAAYDAATKIFTLTPVYPNQKIPETGIVPVSFIPPVDFHTGDKIRFAGYDFDVSYDNTEIPVTDGAFRAGLCISMNFQILPGGGVIPLV